MATTRLIQRYQESVGSPMFLASLFKTPESRFFTEEEIEVQVRRSGRNVAIALNSIAANGNQNIISEFTRKKWKPPAYKENVTINAYSLMLQQFGTTEYDTVNYAAALNRGVELAVVEQRDMIRRAIEIQCSQILQTGALSLLDSDSNERFGLDFNPKSTHFPTVANSWAGGTGTPIADLSSLQEVIRIDGKRTAKRAIFGRLAWQYFKADADVQEVLNSRRKNEGNIERPQLRSEDAAYHGMFTLDNNEIELWTYNASYDNPDTGADTKFVEDDKVILLPEDADLHIAFGAIPRIGDPDPRVAGRIPTRVPIPEKGLALDLDAWLSLDRTSLTVQVATRALAIPTAIDTFGCLDVVPA